MLHLRQTHGAARRVSPWDLVPALLGLALAAGHLHAAPAGPRLHLAVNESVRPGDLVSFQWDQADSAVTEMEILLSLDGGRSYRDGLTPQLDPRTGAYSWRVPNLGTACMRFRIRYNRGGREIEGSPSRFLWVLAHPPDPVTTTSPITTEPEGREEPRGRGDSGTPGAPPDGNVRAPGQRKPLEEHRHLSTPLPAGPAPASARRDSAGERPSGGPPLLFVPPRE